MTHSML